MMVKRRSTSRSTSSRLPPSTRSRPPPPSTQNRLLATLPIEDYERLLPALEAVPLKLKDVLHKTRRAAPARVLPGRWRLLLHPHRIAGWRNDRGGHGWSGRDGRR